LHRTEFTTPDPEVARDFLDRAYGGRLQLSSGASTRWELTVSQIETGLFAMGDVRSPAHLRFSTRGGDSVIVSVAVGGAVEFESGKTIDRFLPGDVYVANQPESHRACRTLDAHVRGVTLPVSLFSTVTPHRPIRFTAVRPASAAAAQQWKRTAHFVHSLLAGPTGPADPLVIGSVARLLAATALVIFPNDLRDGPRTAEKADTAPSSLRRAIAFIESHPDADLSVVDIAAAACVSVRAVQMAFRRHLGTTPMAYLRRVRLDCAHRDLLATDPTGGETVTAIAARWGFAHPGRFAAAYRRTYGRPPGATLRG
jgi:AraC-like DNA-binding protein